MSEIEKIGGIEDAFRHADESVGEFLKMIPLEELRGLKPERFIIDIHPEITAIGHSPETQGYRLTGAMAGLLVGKARRSSIVHGIAVEICAANIFNNYPLPAPLPAFAALTLRGQGPKPPSKRGPPSGGNFVIKMLLRSLTLYLVDLYDIRLTRNKASPPISACDAIVAAAAKHGLHYGFDAVHGWHMNKDHADFRQQADEIMDLVKDMALIHWGVLRPRMGN